MNSPHLTIARSRGSLIWGLAAFLRLEALLKSSLANLNGRAKPIITVIGLLLLPVDSCLQVTKTLRLVCLGQRKQLQ